MKKNRLWRETATILTSFGKAMKNEYICGLVTLKTMRRFITTFLLAVLSILALAQTTDGTLKFLGIPIDGTKEEVSTQLKSKGFRYNSYKECFTGEFNGKTVDVFVVTNHDLVYRICVVYPQQSDREIISEYNVLLSQFNRNKKYFALSKNSPISAEEHIAYEMSANNKEYSAGYAYISPELFSEEEVDQLHDLLSQAPEMSQEEISSMVQSMMGSWVDNESQLSAEDALVILQKFSSILYGRVWFTIVEGLAQYNIVIYYDNAKNQPNGEDL